MALEISYSPLFFENLKAILKFFDERNGSDNFSKKLLKMIHKQIKLAASMPEDIYACQTNPEERMFKKQ